MFIHFPLVFLWFSHGISYRARLRECPEVPDWFGQISAESMEGSRLEGKIRSEILSTIDDLLGYPLMAMGQPPHRAVENGPQMRVIFSVVDL